MSKKEKEQQTRFDALFGAARQPQEPETETQPTIDNDSPAEPIAKGKDPNYQRTTVYLPKALHRKLKTAAIAQEREMSDIIEKLIEKWLDSNV
ncbi:CopG family transcriptional regulator [Cyanobacteria bacterium FACHB-502]|nr:CopG family transcriptional regulator [Cyanobacteria bacterium FACHB-502]